VTKRSRHLTLGAVFTLATVYPRSASADEPPRQVITVRVYDYTPTLSRAKQDVSRICRQAGIDVTWINAPDTNPAASFAIQIMIRRRPVDGSTSASGSAMGTSLGDTHDVGGSAFVFRDRVTHVAHARQQDVARVLGYAMAHEMGHLRLPYPAHSTNGIMRAQWVAIHATSVAASGSDFAPPAPHVFLVGKPKMVVHDAIAGAVRRLAKPECQRLFDDFENSDGQPLAEILSTLRTTPSQLLTALYFVDGDGSSQCASSPSTAAFTEPGSRVIHVCGGRRALRAEDERRRNPHHSRALTHARARRESADERPHHRSCVGAVPVRREMHGCTSARPALSSAKRLKPLFECPTR